MQLAYFRKPDRTETYRVRQGDGSQVAQMVLHGMWAKVSVGHRWCPMAMLAPHHVRNSFDNGELIEQSDADELLFSGNTFVFVAKHDRESALRGTHADWREVEGKLVSHVMHPQAETSFVQISDMVNAFAKTNDERFGSPTTFVTKSPRALLHKFINDESYVGCSLGALARNNWRTYAADRLMHDYDLERVKELVGDVESIRYVGPTNPLDDFAERMRKLRGLT